MISFNTYLAESTQAENAFVKAKAISKYITSDRRKQQYEAALDLLAKAAKDKVIYNASFGDAYSYGISRGMEYAWDELRKTYNDEIKQWELSNSSDLYSLAPPKINKFIKELKGFKNAEVQQFMSAIEGLPDAIKVVKTYIVKGRAPKPGAQTAAKPLASREAAVQANKFLQQAVASFEDKMRQSVVGDWLEAFDKVKDIRLSSKLPTDSRTEMLFPIMFIKKSSTRVGGNVVYSLELKPNAREGVEKAANDTVTNIVADFLNKNTGKLAKIFEKKGEPTVHKIVRTNVRNSVIENLMHFEFADGSMFDINTQVIYKYSKNGKLFAQFPTRFTNVKYADGTKMSMPSEAKMAKEF